jgi:hypothetical protein
MACAQKRAKFGLPSHGAAKRGVIPAIEHRQHKGLNKERKIRTSRRAKTAVIADPLAVLFSILLF